MKGIHADVYRNSAHDTDCTLGGPSSRCSGGTLLAPGLDPVFEPDERHPAYVLRELGGRLNCVPADPETGQPLPAGTHGVDGWMFGGNFLYSCDSRFQRVAGGALPIHDRQER